MENFNSDPKPGRLILPLVLIGMIATTYTFINRVATQNDLEIIEENISTEDTTVETIEEPTTTSTTTTTIPEDVVSYLEEITGEKIQAIELGKKVLETIKDGTTKLPPIKKLSKNFKSLLKISKILLVFFQNLVHQLINLV